MAVLIKELESGTATINLNTTELSYDIQKTVELVTAFMTSLMNTTVSGENFFNVAGFQTVMNNMQGTLNQRLMKLSQEL